MPQTIGERQRGLPHSSLAFSYLSTSHWHAKVVWIIVNELWFTKLPLLCIAYILREKIIWSINIALSIVKAADQNTGDKKYFLHSFPVGDHDAARLNGWVVNMRQKDWKPGGVQGLCCYGAVCAHCRCSFWCARQPESSQKSFQNPQSSQQLKTVLRPSWSRQKPCSMGWRSSSSTT